MTPSEIKDYEQLKKIKSLCKETESWDGPVSFESILDTVSSEMHNLKVHIGQRIVDNTGFYE
jgi:hypothetical protein